MGSVIKVGKPDLHRKRKSLNQVLERLRLTLGFEVSEWADQMGLDESNYRRILCNQADLSLINLSSIAERYHLSLDKILGKDEEGIDFSAIESAFGKNPYGLELPKKYSQHAYSRRWSSVNYLKYVEDFMGWHTRRHVLQYLQVPESAFQKADEKINVNFITDMLGFLERQYDATAQFYTMGAYSVVTYQDTKMGQLLRFEKSVGSLYERLFGELISKYLEQNCSYRLLSLTQTSCVIEATESKGLADALGVRKLGSRAFCMTKVGLAAAVPGYLGLPFGDAMEVACVHNGDERCKYEVNFERSVKAMQSESVLEKVR